MEQHLIEKGERSLALAKSLLEELSLISVETYALYKAPADDMGSASALLCRLASTMGLDRDDLLRLRQVCDNLAWSCRDGAPVEIRTACGLRFTVLVIDAMRRHWPRVIERQDPPEPPPGAN